MEIKNIKFKFTFLIIYNNLIYLLKFKLEKFNNNFTSGFFATEKIKGPKVADKM
jgi:hypothetical protein